MRSCLTPIAILAAILAFALWNGSHMADSTDRWRDQLQQVAGVLLDNAIKYAPQGVVVYMTLTQAERKAVLTVENGGPPIPPEVLPHLFDRFYRADGSRTQGGFGLGLSIAQAIVREHKGTIRCESDRRSTRFIVTLPAGGKK